MAAWSAQSPPGPLRDAQDIKAAVSRFGAELGPRMRGDGRPEDRLRTPTATLLKELGVILGRDVVVHEEVTLPDGSARPDLAIDLPAGRVGYIELKAPVKGIPGKDWRPRKHDREQFDKLRVLPNLIYTNGNYWGLYRKGELVGAVATLHGDLASAGARLNPAGHEFERVLRDFFDWSPEHPRSLQGIVSDVAPLCRLLRDQVAETMAFERVSPDKRPFTTLASEWRALLFPNLSDGEFADAYAQAVTFALLLARVDGVSFENYSLTEIAAQLSKQHSLMGEALSMLINPRWAQRLTVVETLRRVIGHIDWDKIDLGNSAAYTLLYETFLAEYDPKLRRQSGTYYTPDAVAQSMVRFADRILKSRLAKTRGFASDDVIVVDPAMGTGTFLVEIINCVVETLAAERQSRAAPRAHLRELFSRRLVGFELQVAPFAIAEMRLHHTLRQQYGVELPREEVRFLSNALDDPDTSELIFGQLYDVLKETREGANRIKRDIPVMVVIGNPPWRERARGDAPWIEPPRDSQRLMTTTFQDRPSLDEFRAKGQSRRAFNLSNMWTFFWRWATWKVFDANPEDPAGIVVLITPRAYVTSRSHAGMRRYLRETADEGWVIDLTPEGFQPKVSTRVFPGVQQPICIGAFARYGSPDKATPARVHHRSVSGAQLEKFEQLLSMELDDAEWDEVSADWEAPFQPVGSDWAEYLSLADLFPWQQPGVTSNRSWVYAADRATLTRRWQTLVHADPAARAEMFKETDDRKVNRRYPTLAGIPGSERPLLEEGDETAAIVPVGYRSFERQYLIHDRRVVDRPRPELWQVYGERQIYTFELHSHVVTDGPALTFSALVPDNCYFLGHHGGRALPLFRDSEATEPNIAPGLLAVLGAALSCELTPKDLLAYVAAVVAHSGYADRFREELTSPGIRVALSADAELWREAIEIGNEVLWLHTLGERCYDDRVGRPRGLPLLPAADRPVPVDPIPTSEEQMPDEIAYEVETETLVVGSKTATARAGRIARVPVAVWEYRVGGGVPVVRRWFNSRLRGPGRKRRSSPLDDIGPARWTSQFDDELLVLLNALGRCVALEPRQIDLLDRICAGGLVTAADLDRRGVLPVAAEGRRKPRVPRWPDAFNRTD